MRVFYDRDTDILKVVLSETPSSLARSEVAPGILANRDEMGNIVALEILNASERIELPEISRQMVAAD